jgi:hypothetical protein
VLPESLDFPSLLFAPTTAGLCERLVSRNACRLLVAIGALLTFVGCRQQSEIREYHIDSETEKVLTSELLRSQFETVPFRWKVPEAWARAENDQFSRFAWQTGAEGSAARITLSDLPASAGIEAQFVRWQGQLQVSDKTPEELMKSVQELSLGSAQGQWIEIRGSAESILGMIVPHRGKLWVFKYRGPNDALESGRTEFRSFCESMTAA